MHKSNCASCHVTVCQSDLEQVSVHYLQAAGGAHRLPRQGGHRGDGGRAGGEGGRRVAVVLENIIRPGGTLSQATV